MHIFAIILLAGFFVLLLLVLALFIFSAILRSVWHTVLGLFGIKRKQDNQGRKSFYETVDNVSYDNSPADISRKRHEKVFDDDEGEYVDFEEIKENSSKK